MSTPLPEPGIGVLFPVSTTTTESLPVTAVFNPGKSPRYHSHFTNERMDTQKGKMNAQVQGQDAPEVCLVRLHCAVTLPPIAQHFISSTIVRRPFNLFWPQ